MQLVPERRERFADEVPSAGLGDFVETDGQRLARRIRGAYRKAGFAGIRRVARDALLVLEATPRFHAMMRHLLESIDRVSWLAPQHESAATERGLGSTTWMSWLLVKGHLLYFREAARLDRLAAPLHAQGVPIIHQDVPPIGRDPLPEDI